MKQEKTQEDDSWLSKNLSKTLGFIVVFAALAALSAGFIYYSHMGNVTGDPQTWGQFGDFLGGTLNPVFGFLTIIALVLTLILQNRELKMSREELELSREELRKSAEALEAQNKSIDKQNFEQTFFSWLNTYSDVLASIELSYRPSIFVGTPSGGRSSDPEIIRRGRRALQHWWDIRLDSEALFGTLIHKSGLGGDEVDEVRKSHPVFLEKYYPMIVGNALQQWDSLYKEYEYQLDNLFRVLYRLIKWIDSQDERRLSNEEKWFYVSIVRARLSWIEMVYIFYNGLTTRGRNFKVYVEKYALFDNLNFDSDPVIKIVKENPPNNQGFRRYAYSSNSARESLGIPEG